MKQIIFYIMQVLIISIILIFYLLTKPSDTNNCDIDTDINFSLHSYILFSIVSLLIISFIHTFSVLYLKTKIKLQIILLTVSYIILIFIAIGGIFIAQQMNTNSNCSKFFFANKNIFSIYITLLFITIINFIYKSIKCKDGNINEYRPLLISI